MHLDVQELRNFYYRSKLGRAAQKAVSDCVLDLWPDAKGQNVVGFGFAVPLLRPYLVGARRVIGLMPGPQGVMNWPAGMPNISVLCDETAWPIDTGHVDRLIVMHGLEVSERPSDLLDECARVLGPGGRAIFVVPNRGGLWSRSDKTPFGFGRPYSLTQLEEQLKRHGFMPENHRTALYRPPSERRFWMKTGPMWEKAGRSVSAILAGGALIVEVSKRVHNPSGFSAKMKARSRTVLEGLSEPSAKPISTLRPSS